MGLEMAQGRVVLGVHCTDDVAVLFGDADAGEIQLLDEGVGMHVGPPRL